MIIQGGRAGEGETKRKSWKRGVAILCTRTRVCVCV